MEKQFSVGGWVRCIKSGLYGNMPFKEGEHYQIVNISKYFVTVRQGEEKLLLSKAADTTYGLECEWVGMENPEEYPIF